MKKFLVVLASLFVLLLGAAMALPFFVDINRFKGTIEKLAQEKSGYGVEIGRISWKLLPTLSIRLEDFHVQGQIDTKSADLFSARGIQVALRWGPLLRKNLEVKEIMLEAPKIFVVRSKDGKVSLAIPGGALEAQPPRPRQGGKRRRESNGSDQGDAGQGVSGKIARDQRPFQLDNFQIEGGSVEFREQRPDGSTFDLKLEDLQGSATDIALGEKIRFKGKAKMEGAAGSAVKVSGWLGPLEAADWKSVAWKDIDLDIRLAVNGLDARKFGYLSGLSDLYGTLDLDVSAVREDGKLSFEADCRGKDIAFSMPGETAKTVTPSVRVLATGWQQNDTLTLDKAKLTVGSTKASLREVSYGLKTRDFQGMLDATLRLEDMLPWLAKTQDAMAQGEARVDVTIKGNRDRSRDMQIEGSIAMDAFRLQWPGVLKKAVEGKGSVQIQKDLILIRSLDLKVGKSDLRIEGKIRAKGEEPGQISLESEYLDLEELLGWFERPAARRAGPGPGVRQTPMGVLKAEPVSSTAAAAPKIRGIAGPAQAAADPAEGIGRWSFQGNCRIGQLVYQRNRLRNLHGELYLDDGVFTLSRFTAEGFGGSLSTAFQCDLRDPQFAFRWGMRLTEIQINDILVANSDFAGRVSGTVTSNLELTGRAPGSLDDLLASLEGSGQAEVREMTISTFDLMERLSLITGLLGLDRDRLNETRFDTLKTSVRLQGGRVWTPDLQATGNNFDLAGRGSFGFDRTLDYNVQVTLARDLTLQLGQGELVRALLGRDGRMTVPFALRGRIDGPPQFTPLWEDLLVRQLGDYLGRRVFKGRTAEESAPPQDPSQQEPTQGSAVEDLLLQLLKK